MLIQWKLNATSKRVSRRQRKKDVLLFVKSLEEVAKRGSVFKTHTRGDLHT